MRSSSRALTPIASTTRARRSKSKSATKTPSGSNGKKLWRLASKISPASCPAKRQSGQLPGKTIIFAMTKKHAHRIAEVFEEMYPQHVGVVQVVTSTTERVRDGSYGDGLITKFKKNNLPRIAISVDMLDTGIDVPEVVNLVFMKPVQSRI
jgi:type I site-specific restriction endonuclease